MFSLGYEDLSAPLRHGVVWQAAALLLVAKFIATVACYGLGGCGGIFSPTLFFGGMTGVVLAGLAGVPLDLQPGDHMVLAVVGMSACLSAVVRAPVTGILIVFEMTHEFALVPALMIGALASQMIARRFTRQNFYEQVLVDDGQTVVLGGIYEIESRDTFNKVPVLGDIPGVGYLFRSRSSVDNNAELLIFVTPRILREGARIN